MKPVFSFFCFLLLVITSEAQDYKDQIRADFTKYVTHLAQKEFPQSMDYMNPAFLKVVPKDKLIEVMEKTFNNPEIEIELDSTEIMSVDDKKLIKGENFAKLKYTNLLRMKFNAEGKEKINTDETFANLKEQFGEENVRFDKTSEFFTIRVYKNVVANSKDLQRWTFVVVEERQKSILVKFLPEEML